MNLINNDADVLVIGLGLMGGSYARAFKKLGFRVEAIERRESAVEFALRNNIVDAASTEVTPEMVGKADIVVFGLYPEAFLEWTEKYQSLFKPGCLITDVTGVKSSVVYKIQAMLRPDVEFIASHPMAGREVYGVENSTDAMFKGANFIVVPTDKNTDEAITFCKQIGYLLGFGKISVLSPEEHDDMIGFLSQLTHCIAVSLMNTSDDQRLVDYTGDSFRDLTRIARINDEMWSELFLMNKEPLLKHMDQFIDEITNFRELLAKDDREGMREKMRISTERRAWFDKRKDK